MEYTLGVLFLVVGLAASIALHELGHMVPAKRFGVRVTQYMVGFGPTLWSRRRGETEYGIKAIPLGGYIRMIGMYPPARASRRNPSGRLGTMIEDARAETLREIRPDDAGRVFYALPVPKRLVIMFGGPFMNLVIAVVLLTISVTVFGVVDSTTRLAVVNECVLPAGSAERDCRPGDPAAPAAQAGLLPDDVVVSIAGVDPDGDWETVRSVIRENAGTSVAVVVERDGTTVDLEVTPLLSERETFSADGRVVLDDGGNPVTEAVGFLGVSPQQALVPQPATAVVGIIGDGLVRTIDLVVNLPARLVGVADAAFGDAERDPEGPASVVGAGRVAGTIAALDPELTYGTTGKVANLVNLLAGLNLALFVFNLVPLLPLDGGHIAGALWEGARRRWAALRGAVDPGPVDIARALPATYAVAVVFLSMTVLLVYADIVAPVQLIG